MPTDLTTVDEELSSILQAERNRQRETLSLIASENHVSEAVLWAQGSVFTNNDAEGNPALGTPSVARPSMTSNDSPWRGRSNSSAQTRQRSASLRHASQPGGLRSTARTQRHHPLAVADIAHLTGLVAAGVHPSSVGVADVVTCSTHKTVRPGRGGMVMCDENFASDVDCAVMPGTQGGPLVHNIAGKPLGSTRRSSLDSTSTPSRYSTTRTRWPSN